MLLARRAILSRPISPINSPAFLPPSSSDLIRHPVLCCSGPGYIPSAYPSAAQVKLRSGKEAGATGLEPAASGVTGRRSNQLNYAPAKGTAKFTKSPSPFQAYTGYLSESATREGMGVVDPALARRMSLTRERAGGRGPYGRR